MPKTASASVLPYTWAMPQLSRRMVTSRASCSHRAISGVLAVFAASGAPAGCFACGVLAGLDANDGTVNAADAARMKKTANFFMNVPSRKCGFAMRRGYKQSTRLAQRQRLTYGQGAGAPGAVRQLRSEERRVGKECRSRWS